MSARAPAARAKRNTGRVVAACTKATIKGLGESEVISQPDVTSCIQVPVLDTTVAPQRSTKVAFRKGLHIDVLSTVWPVMRQPRSAKTYSAALNAP